MNQLDQALTAISNQISRYNRFRQVGTNLLKEFHDFLNGMNKHILVADLKLEGTKLEYKIFGMEIETILEAEPKIENAHIRTYVYTYDPQGKRTENQMASVTFDTRGYIGNGGDDNAYFTMLIQIFDGLNRLNRTFVIK